MKIFGWIAVLILFVFFLGAPALAEQGAYIEPPEIGLVAEFGSDYIVILATGGTLLLQKNRNYSSHEIFLADAWERKQPIKFSVISAGSGANSRIGLLCPRFVPKEFFQDESRRK